MIDYYIYSLVIYLSYFLFELERDFLKLSFFPKKNKFIVLFDYKLIIQGEVKECIQICFTEL